MKKITKIIAAVLAAATIAITASVAASAEGKMFVISGDDFRAAYSVSGENIINYITFKKIENYQLQFVFRTKNGMSKTYTAESTHLKAAISYLPMQDMLDKLRISADDIADITISGASFDNIEKMSFSLNGAPIVNSAPADTAN